MSLRIAEIASPRGTDGAFATHVTVCNAHPPIVHLRFGLGAEPRANVAADREFRMREDPVREAFGRTGEYDGHSYEITVTKRVSGRCDFVCADFPDVTHTHDDEETGFAEFVGKLSMARELREQAQTVDGERAKVVHGNGAPKQTTFIRLDPVELATKLAEAEDALAAAKVARKPYNDAVTDAEKLRDGLIDQLIAAGHQAQPAREEAPVTA